MKFQKGDTGALGKKGKFSAASREERKSPTDGTFPIVPPGGFNGSKFDIKLRENQELQLL